ncbi:MAG: YihY/virulence factor BrkB family protein [Rhodomicrobium sp.]
MELWRASIHFPIEEKPAQDEPLDRDSMKRSALEILAVTLAVAATLSLLSRVLSASRTTVPGSPGSLAAARDQAGSPFSFSWKQWKSLLFLLYKAIGSEQVGLLAAGVAFYALFALFPGLGAATWLFSLLADPTTIQQQADQLRDVVPAEAYKLIEQQLVALASKNSPGFSVAGIVSLLVALYSARLAALSTMQALNVIYKVEETRSFIRTNAIAILFTVVAIVVFLLAIVALVVLPALFSFIGFPPLVENLVRYLRWPVLAALAVIALALTYRFGPNRKGARWRWITWGSVTATVIWLIASFGFSWYVSAFGSYDRVYGSLGAVVILLFWFWLTAFSALFGAELDRLIECPSEHESSPWA